MLRFHKQWQNKNEIETKRIMLKQIGKKNIGNKKNCPILNLSFSAFERYTQIHAHIEYLLYILVYTR